MLNKLYHRIRFLIRAHKYKSGYDKDEINYLLDKLSEGDVAFDIGAHKAAYTYWMRKAVKEDGKVICMEPQPVLTEYLKNLMSIFRYSNVEVLNYAVSDRDGEAEIIVPGKAGNVSQCARIADPKHLTQADMENLHKIKVKTRSVDSIIREMGMKPKMVKIDVEGHELSVLKGMKKTLAEIRPILIVESEARHIKEHSVFDVFDFILSKDYEGYYYHTGNRKKLAEFDLERDQTMILQKNKKPDLNYIANFIFEPI